MDNFPRLEKEDEMKYCPSFIRKKKEKLLRQIFIKFKNFLFLCARTCVRFVI